jgi:hypothetical protein
MAIFSQKQLRLFRKIDFFRDDYLSLGNDGILIIKKGYAWDGPSGPTIDTLSFMRGSLVHDALYQLMRMGKILYSHKDHADRLLQKICIDDGMSKVRAWGVYQAVKLFGGSSAKPGSEKPEKFYAFHKTIDHAN